MTRKEIEELVKFVRKSGVSEVTIEQKGFKITIKNPSKVPEQVFTHVSAPAVPMSALAPHPAQEAPPARAAHPQAGEPGGPAAALDESKLHVIKSPMIGTFYRAAGPEKPNFIEVGDEIKPGKVLCIIEAMKLFNEIESDVAGRIVKVLVDNATPVEYDQPLFLVEPA
jgi:acetyl-CoA carboxylase biotin carboxyl carrier protein